MDLALPQAQDRRLEIVADGLALFGGMQLAVVSPLHCGGTARPGAGDTGVALVQARRKKERTYPVGGLGWREGGPLVRRDQDLPASSGPHQGQSGIAHPPWQGRASGDSSILACSAARAFAAYLLSLRLGRGADGDVPRTHEVVNDFRHDSLLWTV